MAIDLDAYLDRIAYDGPLAHDAATLARLHEAHVGSIPFENLDLLLGRGIRLDLDALEAKLVAARRGGYCFEHGTLFKSVLDRLGFAAHILCARVRFRNTSVAPRAHMILKVETSDGAMLADVGFGGMGLLRPIPLMPDVVSHVPGAAYRLRHDGPFWVLEGDADGAGFVDYYAFTLEPHYPIDIEVANHYIATHPNSPFRRMMTVQLTRPGRRAVLRDGVLELRHDGKVERREVAGDEPLLALLEEEFGLAFPAGTRFAAQSASG